MVERADLLQGTLELLILKTLRLGSLHGWGISKRVRQLSDEVLQIQQGSLYPALYRLEERGLIEAAWGISPEGRRAKFYTLTTAGRAGGRGGPPREARGAKFYTLTTAGRARLLEERANWRLFTRAVEAVLKA